MRNSTIIINSTRKRQAEDKQKTSKRQAKDKQPKKQKTTKRQAQDKRKTSKFLLELSHFNPQTLELSSFQFRNADFKSQMSDFKPALSDTTLFLYFSWSTTTLHSLWSQVAIARRTTTFKFRSWKFAFQISNSSFDFNFQTSNFRSHHVSSKLSIPNFSNQHSNFKFIVHLLQKLTEICRSCVWF